MLVILLGRVLPGTVSIIDIDPTSSTYNQVTGIVTDENPPTFYTPYYIAVYPNNQLLLVANETNNSISVVYRNVQPVITVYPPSYPQVQTVANNFLLFTDLMNHITWQAPLTGDLPVQYNVYRDEGLTQLIGVVRAGQTLELYDHNCTLNQVYNYYLVSVNADGTLSSAVGVHRVAR